MVERTGRASFGDKRSEPFRIAFEPLVQDLQRDVAPIPADPALTQRSTDCLARQRLDEQNAGGGYRLHGFQR
jgi:hypothetical protein